MEFWHLLNRGVDKRKVFLEEADYVHFLRDLFLFNDRKYVCSTTRKESGGRTILTTRRDLLVYIHSFCLMPNHYHLLVSAVNDDMANISLFMKKLNKGYAQHFNHKYDRSGALWEGKYKKVHIVRDNHFLYIPYYIHLNPLDLHMPEWRHGAVKNTKKALKYLNEYRWSSHLDYMNQKNFSSILNMEVWDNEHPLKSRRKYEQELISIMTRQNLAEQSSRLE